ncbi:MAG TPA: hypothetical protein DDZ89_06435 [Clostridiales bacterium]|nr:hypothetical protein [Clostridiales bacterium]
MVDFSDKMSGYSQKKLQIMVIMAHPADTFDHCGGTLMHHVRKGDHVTVVSVLQGVRVHDAVVSDQLRYTGGGQKPEEAKAIRDDRSSIKYKEVSNACKILGIEDVRFLGVEDKINLVNEPNIIAIAKLIREVKPDILITHYPKINMGIGQHPQIGTMVVHAMGFAGSIDFDDPNPAHKTAQLFFAFPDNYNFKATALDADTTCHCDVFVDVSDVVEEITRARNCMSSQQYSGNYARKSVETSFGVNGNRMRTGYAEPFIRYKPELLYYLPLPERFERWANEKEKDQLERRAYMVAPYVDL